MERPAYLSKYLLDWELIDVIVGGRSALDSKFFVGPMVNQEQVYKFLSGYGLEPEDPIIRAELFGNFQEAIQFIKRYFLKEGNPEGLDLKIPNSIFMITDIADLFVMATGGSDKPHEERLWAEIVLKVMHTILHTDKDLRSNYFHVIQQQIFDRFYKLIWRDDNDKLHLGPKNSDEAVPLLDFITKSKKSRESVIIKLLHKAENVAEELFDRVGVRLVTESRVDTLRAIRILIENNVVIPHNIKPSRSINTMIDLEKFKDKHQGLIKMALRNNLDEEGFLEAINREVMDCQVYQKEDERNQHSLSNYQAIQFTCRQLIKYKNPFLKEFKGVRKLASEMGEDNALAKKILDMDISLISRDVRFFYPFEVQIMDKEANLVNTEGEASHDEYKKSQVKSAMKRVFWALLKHKNISLD
ncbi:MAG: TIGR04552 family protein [Bacteriovoracaceae bacterium]|nr:TIGR04552 family protein [Bacteriovoracaceae bacterium]